MKSSEPDSVSILLQIPMYVLITAGEIMFSITGLEFAYSQVSSMIISDVYSYSNIMHETETNLLCMYSSSSDESQQINFKIN